MQAIHHPLAGPLIFIDPDPRTGRRVVTVAQWDKRPDSLVDESAYWFDQENADFGLDPWSVIDGIDKHTDDHLYDVWMASGKCRSDIAGRQRIYIAAKHFDLLAAA